MKSIKSKIRMIVLVLLVVNSILIGVITSLLNVKGIDRIMETTVAPVSRITAQAVKWRLDNYWAPLTEAASMRIFLDSQPTDPELIAFAEETASRNGFLYVGKMNIDEHKWDWLRWSRLREHGLLFEVQRDPAARDLRPHL